MTLEAAREYRLKHPQRVRELIIEGLAWRRSFDPGYAIRNATKARAASKAKGWRPGPTREQLALATSLRRQGLSWRRIAVVLRVGSAGTVLYWRNKGWLALSKRDGRGRVLA